MVCSLNDSYNTLFISCLGSANEAARAKSLLDDMREAQSIRTMCANDQAKLMRYGKCFYSASRKIFDVYGCIDLSDF